MKNAHISLSDVENYLTLRTWWAIWGVLPIANRLVVLITNHTNVSPNCITATALGFRIISGCVFFIGRESFLPFGALFFYCAYVLDCVDGPVARLTGKSSEFGRYFDHISDLVGDLFILFCLGAGQHMAWTIILISMGMMHISEAFICYLCSFILNREQNTPPPLIIDWRGLNWYARYRTWFFYRNIKSFISFPDYTAMVYIFFPLVGFPKQGLINGFFILCIIVLYTIFSAFWCIHSNDSKFP